MADALREHFSAHGPTPLYVVVGRGGPNLVRGMGALRDTCDALALPYRLFGFDSDMERTGGSSRPHKKTPLWTLYRASLATALPSKTQ